jgi:hypothetical protein
LHCYTCRACCQVHWQLAGFCLHVSLQSCIWHIQRKPVILTRCTLAQMLLMYLETTWQAAIIKYYKTCAVFRTLDRWQGADRRCHKQQGSAAHRKHVAARHSAKQPNQIKTCKETHECNGCAVRDRLCNDLASHTACVMHADHTITRFQRSSDDMLVRHLDDWRFDPPCFIHCVWPAIVRQIGDAQLTGTQLSP